MVVDASAVDIFAWSFLMFWFLSFEGNLEQGVRMKVGEKGETSPQSLVGNPCLVSLF